MEIIFTKKEFDNLVEVFEKAFFNLNLTRETAKWQSGKPWYADDETNKLFFIFKAGYSLGRSKSKLYRKHS